MTEHERRGDVMTTNEETRITLQNAMHDYYMKLPRGVLVAQVEIGNGVYVQMAEILRRLESQLAAAKAGQEATIKNCTVDGEPFPTPPPAEGGTKAAPRMYCPKCYQGLLSSGTTVNQGNLYHCEDCERFWPHEQMLVIPPPAEGSAYATAMCEDFGVDINKPAEEEDACDCNDSNKLPGPHHNIYCPMFAKMGVTNIIATLNARVKELEVGLKLASEVTLQDRDTIADLRKVLTRMEDSRDQVRREHEHTQRTLGTALGERDDLHKKLAEEMEGNETLDKRSRYYLDLATKVKAKLATAVQEVAERTHTQHFTDDLLAKVRKERDDVQGYFEAQVASNKEIVLSEIDSNRQLTTAQADTARLKDTIKQVGAMLSYQESRGKPNLRNREIRILSDALLPVPEAATAAMGTDAKSATVHPDTVRLDWLAGIDSMKGYTLESGFYGYEFDDFGAFHGDTLRESIDAVIKWQSEANTAKIGTVSKTETVEEDIALLKTHAQAKAFNATNDDAAMGDGKGETIAIDDAIAKKLKTEYDAAIKELDAVAERIKIAENHGYDFKDRGEKWPYRYSFDSLTQWYKTKEAALEVIEANIAKEGGE